MDPCEGKEHRMEICVGNLPGNVTGNDLREIFESFGRVETVHVTRSRPGEEFKGLGFVGMPVRVEAVSAVLAVHGKMVNGQALTANEVQSRGAVSGVCGTRCLCRVASPPAGNTHPDRAESHGERVGNGTATNGLE
jgi:RNA recognition motif-containing protein